MSTLTLNLSPEEKQYLKSQAGFKGITTKDLVLQAVGYLTTRKKGLSPKQLMKFIQKKKQPYTIQDFIEKSIGKKFSINMALG